MAHSSRLHTLYLILFILAASAILTHYHLNNNPPLKAFIQDHIKNLPLSPSLPQRYEKRPFYLHEPLLAVALLYVALMIPTQRELVAATFIPIIAGVLWRLVQAGSKSPTTGYSIGTFAVFHLYQTLDLLLFSDVRRIFRRIPFGPPPSKNGVAVEAKDAIPALEPGSNSLVKKEGPNGNVQKEFEFSEAYPSDLIPRLLWVSDLTASLRLPGWNRQIPLTYLAPTTTPSKHLLRLVGRALTICLYIDLLCWYTRTVDRDWFVPAHHALSSAPGPVPYPTLFSSSRPSAVSPPLEFPAIPESGWERTLYLVALQTLRTCLAASAMYAAIDGAYTATSILPILAGYLLSVRAPTSSSSAWEIWKYRHLSRDAWPDTFGTLKDGDWSGGIGIFWGRAWHGLFKHVFTAPAAWIIRNCGVERRGLLAQMLRLWIPFVMSGILHLAGNWTNASCGLGSFRFFLLQPMGILIEAGFVRIYSACVDRRGKERVEKVLKFLWTLAWFVVTSQSFIAEYRYGGLWLSEPVPVSVWRGIKGEGWWTWGVAEDGRGWWSWDGWKIVM
ncbi:hypothetical protein RUND412_010730 [Rhizina undulata]